MSAPTTAKATTATAASRVTYPPKFKSAEALMGEIDSPGFDPMPPDHTRAGLFDRDGRPEEKFMALVYMSTIGHGHMRPYACDENGRPRDMAWFEFECKKKWGWTPDWTQRTAQGCADKGKIRLTQKKLYLKGTIPQSRLESTNESEEMAKNLGVATPAKPLPAHVLEAIKTLDKPQQKSIFEKLGDWQEECAIRHNAVLAAEREVERIGAEDILRGFGLDVKLTAAKRVERPVTVTFTFAYTDKWFTERGKTPPAPPDFGSGHSEGSAVPDSPPDRSAHPYIGQTQTDLRSSSSAPECSLTNGGGLPEGPPVPGGSTLPPAAEQGTRDQMELGLFTSALVKIFVSRNLPMPSETEIEARYRDLLPDAHKTWLAESEHTSKNWRSPGVLESDVRKFMLGWPEKRAKVERAKARRAEEERRRHEDAERDKRMIQFQESQGAALDKALPHVTEEQRKTAAERCRKGEGRRWEMLTREQREDRIDGEVKYMLTHRLMEVEGHPLETYDEWLARNAKGATTV
jgi:hypothetical protein